jgi:hypothetical protein
MSKIGFVLITHSKPNQMLRLMDRLLKLFGEPKIVCHHDFGQCPVSVDDFPPSVTFVRPHLDTKWGAFSVVLAILAAMRTLYEDADNPDWFVLLSESDYPIKSGARIVYELENSSYDAYLEHELIDPRELRGEFQRCCYRRYFGKNIRVPRLNRRLQVTWRPFQLESRLLPILNAPFSNRFRCFAGETWFAANRDCAEHILRFHEENRALARRYAQRDNVDESYIHSILGNNSHLRVANNCKRYADWSEGTSHPKILTIDDLPALKKSDAHFARKFDSTVDSMVLDRLDEILV